MTKNLYMIACKDEDGDDIADVIAAALAEYKEGHYGKGW